MNITNQEQLLDDNQKQQIYNPANVATSIAMPTKDANDFRYHRLERDQQYTDLQVSDIQKPRVSFLM